MTKDNPSCPKCQKTLEWEPISQEVVEPHGSSPDAGQWVCQCGYKQKGKTRKSPN